MALYDAALRNCSDDLRDVARRGDAPLVIGREVEARSLAELLLARKSVLLVGEPGVGKSAVVLRLLADVEAGHAGGDASGLRLYRTSKSRVISETKYLGEWQSKLTSVVRDLLAEEFSDLFDGFSIGSNDLTQLTLGIDRDSEILAPLFDERDPAVKRLIAMVVEAAHRKGRKVGICGQAPSDYPDVAEFLAGLGIDSISLTSDSLPGVARRLAGAAGQGR